MIVPDDGGDGLMMSRLLLYTHYTQITIN